MNVKNPLSIGLALACLTLSSCIEEKDLHEEKPITYSEYSFNIGGECSVTETPMNRATGTDKDLYGISVAMLVKNAGETNPTQKPYAYGIFEQDKLKDLKLNLINGYAYRVACTMIVDAKELLKQPNDAGYGRPFTLEKNKDTYGQITNKFITAERPEGTQLYLHDLETTQIGAKEQINIQRPFVKRYHGFIEIPTVIESTPNTGNTLEVFRRYFGIQLKAEGLQKGLELKVQIDDSPAIILTSEKKQSEPSYVSMKNLTAKVEMPKILTDNARLIATVHKTGAEPKQILNYNIAFKRNYMHTIAITNIDYAGEDSGIKVTVVEEELENDAQQDLPWQN